MKIKNRDLKLFYSAYLIDSTPVSRKDCPPKKDIIDLLRAKLPRKMRLKLIDHVSKCFHCYEEFQSIVEIQREEVKLIEAMECLGVKSDETSQINKKVPSVFSLQRRKSILFFPRLSEICILILGIYSDIFNYVDFNHISESGEK